MTAIPRNEQNVAKKRGRLRIGASGYSYDHWRGTLYPDDMPPAQWLACYAETFDTVELRAPFYRIPRPAMVETWRTSTPDDFVFTARANKVITHGKMLRGCSRELGAFRLAMSRLGVKLGAVMWSLPSGFRADLPRLDAFLRVVTRTWRKRHAVEFRHASWLTEETFALLRGHNVSLVNADVPRAKVVFTATADFVYLRRHGAKGSGRKPYGDRDLFEDADQIAAWVKDGLDVMLYFNNDAEGHAIRNARRLRSLCERRL